MLRLCLVIPFLVACPNNEKSDTIKQPQKPAGADDLVKAELAKHMQEDLAAIRTIERALVAGDLEAAKEGASVFVQHEPHPFLSDYKTHLGAVRKTAAALAASADLSAAAKHTASLGNQCAGCHLASSATLSFAAEALPEPVDQKTRMLQHQWAVDRLWEGLIGPVEDSWSRGAAALATAPSKPQFALKEGAERVETMGMQLNQFGKRAQAAKKPAEREALYGELLMTCSSCHTLTVDLRE